MRSDTCSPRQRRAKPRALVRWLRAGTRATRHRLFELISQNGGEVGEEFVTAQNELLHPVLARLRATIKKLTDEKRHLLAEAAENEA